jgi:hypothetical protein
MFPNEHDDIIRLLLFRLAEWHALAKLHLHTDDSLDKLDQALTALGKQLRRFQQFTCSAFQAMELPREVAARQRRQDANLQSTRGEARSSGARPKNFNILTYKLHALGDYTASIRLFGTTDSYTTQIVGVSCLAILAVLTFCVLQGELTHRLIKMLYRSTNKQDTSKQLARQERRRTRIRRHQSSTTLLHDIHTSDLPPETHHFLSGNKCNNINLAAYLGEHKDDPAIKVRHIS